MGMVRIKEVYLRIPSIGECTYTILLETVQLVVQTQCCFLSTIMYVHMNTWNSKVNSLILTIPIKCDVLHALHDSTGYPIMDKWPI